MPLQNNLDLFGASFTETCILHLRILLCVFKYICTQKVLPVAIFLADMADIKSPTFVVTYSFLCLKEEG